MMTMAARRWPPSAFDGLAPAPTKALLAGGLLGGGKVRLPAASALAARLARARMRSRRRDAHLILLVIRRSSPSGFGFFGSRTVSTPLLKLASTLSASISVAKRSVRRNRP